MNPCTCTLACIPAGIVEGQACRLREDVVDPAATRECDGYPALAGGNTPEGVEAQIARLERLAAWRGPCCGDPGDCSECGPSRANVGDE